MEGWQALAAEEAQFTTLQDSLAEGLELVFIGLNPASYSVRAGHYFANPRNRFWRALNQSGLVDRELSPRDDVHLRDYGIGFTDVVKRPTPQASGLTAADFRRWAPVLKNKLLQYQPRIACFHGMVGYKAYLKYGEGVEEQPTLGKQPRAVGVTHIFVVPNPSPANAQFSLEDLVYWYKELKKFWEGLRP
ncbi:MAG: mismatch-specific DNA-glycosylase [SAR202 cluster bacterium]|nr:mismatch-specific DNA-glycosylase [SAR202 cluster bacterium]